jgi:hypothetical protein
VRNQSSSTRRASQVTGAKSQRDATQLVVRYDTMSSYHRRLPMGMLLALAEMARSARGVARLPSVTSIPTSTAAATTSIASVAATATAAKASHLSQTGINLLLGLMKDIHEITSLLLVCSMLATEHVLKMGHWRGHSLSVVKRVMAVPFAPARPVRPIR